MSFKLTVSNGVVVSATPSPATLPVAVPSSFKRTTFTSLVVVANRVLMMQSCSRTSLPSGGPVQPGLAYSSRVLPNVCPDTPLAYPGHLLPSVPPHYQWEK